MKSINDLAIEYGRQVEALLKQLGAGSLAKGAGELLDQVQRLIDPGGLRQVRWFPRLRNRVVHGDRYGSMPSREELERAGRAAVGALQRALAGRVRRGNSARRRGKLVGRREEPGTGRVVFAGLLRLWLWVRFAPPLFHPGPPKGAKGVDAATLPILLDWVFLIMAAHTLYQISGIDRKTKAFRWFAWLATALAVVHLPYALIVPDSLGRRRGSPAPPAG